MSGLTLDPVTAGVVALPFLPLVTVGCCWGLSLGRAWRSHLTVRTRGTATTREAPDESTVPVRIVDEDVPVAAVQGLLFGLRQYIVVSEAVVDALGDDELDALFAHEYYHIRNRDVTVNAIATVSALFALGGRNAFLVFYDYPRIEREADAYAARVTDTESIVGALETYRGLVVQAALRDDTDISDRLPGPQLTGTARERVDDVLDRTARSAGRGLARRVREVVALARRDVWSIYRLFFGDVLFDNVHESVETRIERLEADATQDGT